MNVSESHRVFGALTACLIMFAAAEVAHGSLNSASRTRQFARLPAWSGIWQSAVWVADESGRPPGGIVQVKRESQLALPLPFNAQWVANEETVAKVHNYAKKQRWCTGTFPSLMESPRMFQVVVLPEETMLVFEHGQVRHIYTDGRDHPSAEDLWTTAEGDSTGKWLGEILVVDTIARVSSGPLAWSGLAPASMLSDSAHFTERIRQIDQDTLEDQLTIEDPIALSSAWGVTLKFKRLRMNRLLPYDCQEDDRDSEPPNTSEREAH